MTFYMKALVNCLDRFFPHLSSSEKKRKLTEVQSWCAEHQCHHFIPEEEPSCALREISRPPELLFVRGNPDLLKAVSLAIVGTRGPSSYGRRSAMYFAREAALRGLCVVSGLARGIDSAAHRGALLGNGLTVAVVGHGLDSVYPAMNRGLADEILRKGGALVSEYPPGIPPLPPHFPARNRILSGLSVGVLVVEAALKSGSLITARHALEQNREVFVVPGHFDESSFQGSLGLIQEGAKLVRHPKDLWEELPYLKEALPFPREARWERLADVFRKVEYACGLQKLQEVCGWDLSQLSREISAACEVGLVVETGPQQFLWAGWD